MTFLGMQATDETALVNSTTGERISFRTLLDRGRQVADATGPERALAFLLSRNDEFSVTAYAGLLNAGHALTLLDAAAPPAMTADLVRAYRPTWVAGPAGTGDALAECGISVASVRAVLGGEVARLGSVEPVALHPDVALLLTTSGTTGSRKFVRLSHRNVESNAAAIATALELGATDRPITSLPLHYTFGLSVLNSHWRAGATVVVTDRSVVQREFWDVFRSHGCTSIAGVPYTYAMLERVGFREMDLPSLRSMQQAGGALDPDLTARYADQMNARGVRFWVMYGQTEATARIAYVPPGRLREKVGSAGIAIPGGSISVDVRRHEHDANRAVGEVIFTGPSVMLGYATEATDLAKGDEMDGVLPTGDLGYLDSDGYLFLVGRNKRIAKVFGLRINLDEVEAMLRQHGPVAVVAGQDALWAFCAFGTDASLDEAAAQLGRRLRIHRSALHVQRVTDLPTMPSGKVDYAQVQQWTHS